MLQGTSCQVCLFLYQNTKTAFRFRGKPLPCVLPWYFCFYFLTCHQDTKKTCQGHSKYQVDVHRTLRGHSNKLWNRCTYFTYTYNYSYEFLGRSLSNNSGHTHTLDTQFQCRCNTPSHCFLVHWIDSECKHLDRLIRHAMLILLWRVLLMACKTDSLCLLGGLDQHFYMHLDML